MSNKVLRKMIESSGGKFINVEFVKKDGTHRKLNARMGVVKHLRGGQSTTAHKSNLITVFDVQKNAYRSVNLDTVTHNTMGGVRFDVKDIGADL